MIVERLATEAEQPGCTDHLLCLAQTLQNLAAHRPAQTPVRLHGQAITV
jgi:anti-sigma factor ChrR (cupin superfamily)